jgi:hypothetical protein
MRSQVEQSAAERMSRSDIARLTARLMGESQYVSEEDETLAQLVNFERHANDTRKLALLREEAHTEMLKASGKRRYEAAAKLRDIRIAITQLLEQERIHYTQTSQDQGPFIRTLLPQQLVKSVVHDVLLNDETVNDLAHVDVG